MEVQNIGQRQRHTTNDLQYLKTFIILAKANDANKRSMQNVYEIKNHFVVALCFEDELFAYHWDGARVRVTQRER